jgi:dihydrofolate reductase
MSLAIIVAMTEERVIGKDNHLPWHLSEDLKRFKQITMGHPIIMGRKTYESIGRPLPGRQNIVVTHNPVFHAEGVTVVHDFKDALAQAKEWNDQQFVIGGAALFKLALPLIDRLYLTLIHDPIPGDTYFPIFDLKKDFRVIEETSNQSAQGEKLRFSFITAERVRND